MCYHQHINRPLFSDRSHAGAELAQALQEFAGVAAVVLALPRGGVPVARPVALALHAPLHLFLVRKIRAPGQPELALGAVASGGIQTLNTAAIDALGIEMEILEQIARRERTELLRQERLFREEHMAADLRGKCVILIDDGLATGASMLAAIAAVRTHEPTRIVAAVPVAPGDTARMIGLHADVVRCLHMPQPFGSVGSWYADFRQVSEPEMRNLLA